MFQTERLTLTFQEFLEWYPEDGKRYELINGEIVEMRPVGDHEEIAGLITRKLDREIERLNLPYFIPRTCCIKPSSNIDGYVPDVTVLDRRQLQAESLWKKASTITQGSSAPLVIEVASMNWQDDYAKKLEDYEDLGVQEYWIVDYRALGGRRYIGSPKQPTVSVYTLVSEEYQLRQFRGNVPITSSIFPELTIPATELLIIT
ncbi:MAG: Uma2 family endonuclease [Microcoleaceae cyanobacterium]